MDLNQILNGIKQDEEWAYRVLIDRYGDRINRVAYGILRDRQLAEDTVQDVFIKIFQKINQYHPDKSFYAWIYTITVNQCRNRMRKWSFKNLFFIPQYQSSGEIDKEGMNAEEIILKDEKSRVLMNQIDSLKRIYREVIILYYYEDLQIKEISEILGVNENTVKTRLDRARKYLKANFEKEEGLDHVLSQA